MKQILSGDNITKSCEIDVLTTLTHSAGVQVVATRAEANKEEHFAFLYDTETVNADQYFSICACIEDPEQKGDQLLTYELNMYGNPKSQMAMPFCLEVQDSTAVSAGDVFTIVESSDKKFNCLRSIQYNMTSDEGSCTANGKILVNTKPTNGTKRHFLIGFLFMKSNSTAIPQIYGSISARLHFEDVPFLQPGK